MAEIGSDWVCKHCNKPITEENVSVMKRNKDKTVAKYRHSCCKVCYTMKDREYTRKRELALDYSCPLSRIWLSKKIIKDVYYGRKPRV